MKKGNIIRFTINRAKYHLVPSSSQYAHILCGTIISVHTDKVSVKAMDLWGNKEIKYLTINKKDIIAIL